MGAYKDDQDPSFHTDPLRLEVPTDARSMKVQLSPGLARVTYIELEKRKEKLGIISQLSLALKFIFRF